MPAKGRPTGRPFNFQAYNFPFYGIPTRLPIRRARAFFLDFPGALDEVSAIPRMPTFEQPF